MIAKVIIVVGYLAVCSLITSIWVDEISKPTEWDAAHISVFVIMFLLSPIIFVSAAIDFVKMKLGDKNAGD